MKANAHSIIVLTLLDAAPHFAQPRLWMARAGTKN
jgi:hypothetical protein